MPCALDCSSEDIRVIRLSPSKWTELLLCYDSFVLLGEVAVCAVEMLVKMMADDVFAKGAYTGAKGLHRLFALSQTPEQIQRKPLEQVMSGSRCARPFV